MVRWWLLLAAGVLPIVAGAHAQPAAIQVRTELPAAECAGGTGAVACVPPCLPGKTPTASAPCLRADDLIEMRSGRYVSSRVVLDRDCGADRSITTPQVTIIDGAHGRFAKRISLWLRYASEPRPARTRICASATQCRIEDSRPGSCRPICAGGVWQTLDGRTLTIPETCDPG